MRIFDIHAHIYPDAIAPRAVQALRDGYDGITVECDGRVDTLLRQSEAAGVTAMAVHSVATSAHQTESINRFVLEASRAHPGRLIPFGTLHPDLPDPDAEVRRLAADGFMGIKLHPELQGFRVDEPRALELFRAAAGRLPVLLHCGDPRFDNSSPARIRRMLRQVPGLQLVCAHLGGWTLWQRAADELAGEDLWVDTSSSLYALDPSDAASVIRAYGAGRVLFGVDYPVWNPAGEVARFMRLPLTDAERERILWQNHLDLLRSSR